MLNTRNSRKSSQKAWALLVWGVMIAMLFSGCGKPQQAKVYHVGILSGLDFFSDTTDGFKTQMTKLGYVEDKNIVYDVQKTNIDMAAYKSILQKFVDDKVDLIFVFPTEAALEAKAATQGTNIPVVFAHAVLEGVDLVKSVREPGGNVTGVRFPGPDMTLKRFEIMLQLVPRTKHMLIPYQRGYPAVPSQLEALRSEAAAAGVTLVELPLDNPAELEADMQERAKSADIGFDSILCITEPLMTTPDAIAVLDKFAEEHKIPIGGGPVSKEGYGSLFTTAPDHVTVGNQAAFLVDKIFKGTPAGTIPVLSPEPLLWINYAVAQGLGLTVPEGLLKQAVEILR